MPSGEKFEQDTSYKGTFVEHDLEKPNNALNDYVNKNKQPPLRSDAAPDNYQTVNRGDYRGWENVPPEAMIRKQDQLRSLGQDNSAFESRTTNGENYKYWEQDGQGTKPIKRNNSIEPSTEPFEATSTYK